VGQPRRKAARPKFAQAAALVVTSANEVVQDRVGHFVAEPGGLGVAHLNRW
jgi:hypothetical protein